MSSQGNGRQRQETRPGGIYQIYKVVRTPHEIMVQTLYKHATHGDNFIVVTFKWRDFRRQFGAYEVMECNTPGLYHLMELWSMIRLSQEWSQLPNGIILNNTPPCENKVFIGIRYERKKVVDILCENKVCIDTLCEKKVFTNVPCEKKVSIDIPHENVSVAPDETILIIDRVQRCGPDTLVTYLMHEHFPHDTITQSKASYHKTSWSHFQQLPGAENALSTVPVLQGRIQTHDDRIARRQPQPWNETLFVRAEELGPRYLIPVGFRIVLQTKPWQNVPTARRLYCVNDVYQRNSEYYVEAEIFESYMQNDRSVQGLRMMVYTWSEFKAIDFERTPTYKNGLEKAEGLLRCIDSAEGSQKKVQEDNREKNWFGACLSFF